MFKNVVDGKTSYVCKPSMFYRLFLANVGSFFLTVLPLLLLVFGSLGLSLFNQKVYDLGKLSWTILFDATLISLIFLLIPLKNYFKTRKVQYIYWQGVGSLEIHRAKWFGSSEKNFYRNNMQVDREDKIIYQYIQVDDNTDVPTAENMYVSKKDFVDFYKLLTTN